MITLQGSRGHRRMKLLEPLDHFQIRCNTPYGFLIRMVLKSKTNHNAPIYRRSDGKLCVMDIRWPRNKEYTLRAYLGYLNTLKARWRVVRPKSIWFLEDSNITALKDWRERASTYWAALNGQHYSVRDIYVLMRRLVLKSLSWLSFVKPDKAHLYCTEGTQSGYLLGHWCPENCVDKKMPTPKDYEDATAAGDFIVIAQSEPEISFSSDQKAPAPLAGFHTAVAPALA